MRCDDVADLLPAAVDGNDPVDLPVQRHIESCLRCQAELARYRRMLRGLQLLRTRYLEPSPGLLAATLAALDGGRRAPGRPLDPHRPAPRVRGRHRRRGCRGRRHRGRGHRPRAAAHRPGLSTVRGAVGRQREIRGGPLLS